jgi:hypothetical protein
LGSELERDLESSFAPRFVLFASSVSLILFFLLHVLFSLLFRRDLLMLQLLVYSLFSGLLVFGYMIYLKFLLTTFGLSHCVSVPQSSLELATNLNTIRDPSDPSPRLFDDMSVVCFSEEHAGAFSFAVILLIAFGSC